MGHSLLTGGAYYVSVKAFAILAVFVIANIGITSWNRVDIENHSDSVTTEQVATALAGLARTSAGLKFGQSMTNSAEDSKPAPASAGKPSTCWMSDEVTACVILRHDGKCQPTKSDVNGDCVCDSLDCEVDFGRHPGVTSMKEFVGRLPTTARDVVSASSSGTTYYVQLNSEGEVAADPTDNIAGEKCWQSANITVCQTQLVDGVYQPTLSDVNGDGVCNSLDCRGDSTGDPGKSCYDTNALGQNSVCDVGEDVNLDGKCDWQDCVGPEGAQGDQGIQGTQGIQGVQGLQGDQGPAGAAGPIGPQGVQGVAGAKGDTGDTGPEGPTGPAGPAGAQGVQGPQGDAGPTGPQGDVGPAGAQGVAGPQGDAGPTGPAGADGAVGPQGPQGVAGPQGDAGVQGLQGIQGPAGATGPQGIQGEPGPNTTLGGLLDVNVVGAVSGDGIKFNGATWELGATAGALSDLTDVDVAGASNGHRLTRRGSEWVAEVSYFSVDNVNFMSLTEGDTVVRRSGQWVNEPAGGSATLESLTDTTIVAPDEGYILKFTGGNWMSVEPTDVQTLNDLTDVALAVPGTNDVLVYNGAHFVNQPNSLENLMDVIFGVAPADGNVLTFNAGSWSAAAPVGGGGGNLNSIGDVQYAPAPSEGDFLSYVAGFWQPVAAPSGGGGGATDLVSLADVDMAPAPSLGDVLTYNGAMWTPAPGGGGGGGATSLDGLSDVTMAPAPAVGNVLVFDGAMWTPGTGGGGGGGASTLNELGDVSLITPPPAPGNVLTFDGALWVAAAPSGGGGGSDLNSLSDVMIAPAPAPGDVLTFDGAMWTPSAGGGGGGGGGATWRDVQSVAGTLGPGNWLDTTSTDTYDQLWWYDYPAGTVGGAGTELKVEVHYEFSTACAGCTNADAWIEIMVVAPSCTTGACATYVTHSRHYAPDVSQRNIANLHLRFDGATCTMDRTGSYPALSPIRSTDGTFHSELLTPCTEAPMLDLTQGIKVVLRVQTGAASGRELTIHKMNLMPKHSG